MTKQKLVLKILKKYGIDAKIESNGSLDIEYNFDNYVNLKSTYKGNATKLTVVIGIKFRDTSIYNAEKLQNYLVNFNNIKNCYDELIKNDCIEFEIE